MKHITLFALLLVPAIFFAQSSKYTVKGELTGVKEPAVVYLYYTIEGQNKKDSAVLKNGSFVFTGTVAEPFRASLYTMRTGNYDYIPLLIEKGTIAVTGRDVLAKARVKGTLINEQMDDLRQNLKPSKEKKDQLFNTYYTTDSVTRASETFKSTYKKNYEVIEKEERVILANYIKNNPNTIVSIEALQMYGGYDPEASDLEPLFATLSQDVRNTKQGKEYAAEIERLKLIALNASAPEFAQNDTTGKLVKLSDFRGKYVLVDFWASWCGPCRAENPHVVKAYNRFTDKNFTVLGVSLDDEKTRQAWLKAIRDDNLPWTQISDLKGWKNEAAVLYSIKGIPQNFLLSPDGKIIAKNLRGAALEKKLEEVLH